MDLKYILAGLALLLLLKRNADAAAAQGPLYEDVPIDGSNVVGDLWRRLSGYGLGGAPDGVNTCKCHL